MTMPRYFFHVDGRAPHKDEVGENVGDDEEAWKAALRITRDIETALRPGHEWRLEVFREESRLYVITVSSRHIDGS